MKNETPKKEQKGIRPGRYAPAFYYRIHSGWKGPQKTTQTSTEIRPIFSLNEVRTVSLHDHSFQFLPVPFHGDDRH